uniref:Uncharacterized protein n=1 Tax=Arundo donax TaxID=35708 RepID=A0A0A9F5E8_ARUDO
MKACSSWRSLLSLSHSSSSSQGRWQQEGSIYPAATPRQQETSNPGPNRPQRRDFHLGSSNLGPNQPRTRANQPAGRHEPGQDWVFRRRDHESSNQQEQTERISPAGNAPAAFRPPRHLSL